MRVSTGRQVNKTATASKPCGFPDNFSAVRVQRRRARRRDLTLAAMDASIQRSPAAIDLAVSCEQQRQARALFDGHLRALHQLLERLRARLRARAQIRSPPARRALDARRGRRVEIDGARSIVDELERTAVVRESVAVILPAP